MRSLEELTKAFEEARQAGDVARVEALLAELAEHDGAEATALGHAERAQLCLMRGDLAGAVPWLEKAQELHREHGRRERLAEVSGELGGLYIALRESGKALDAFTLCRELAEDRGDAKAVAGACCNIGIAFHQLGDYPLAQEYYHRALRHAEAAGAATFVANVHCNLGLTCHTVGELDEAMEHLERACAAFEEQGRAAHALGVRSNVARVLASQGRGAECEALLRSLLDQALALGTDAPVADLAIALMEQLSDEGRHDEVAALAEVHGEILRAHPTGAAQLPLLEAQRLEAAGDHPAARVIYEERLRQAEEGGRMASVMDMHGALRDVARATGDFEAYVHHNEAHQRVKEEILGAEAARRFTAQSKHREMEQERAERAREREVLYGALPQDVADRLVRGEQVNDEHDGASVLFLDLAGFTSISDRTTADEVVRLLAAVFADCDAICRRHGLTKVKTIGDAYLAVALPTAGDDDAADADPAAQTAPRAAAAALEMLAAVASREGLSARIGLDTGPVVTGVVGTDRLQYDVWGDTVNTASRMESTAESGTIHVTERFAEALGPDPTMARLLDRGETAVKGKGAMRTYRVEAG